MAVNNFKGWLIKFGNNILPLHYILADGWDTTPNQRVEIDAWRDADAYLHRETAYETKSLLRINIKPLMLSQKLLLDDIISLATLSEQDKIERKVQVTYWNDEIMDYKTGIFYIPDIDYSIRRIYPEKNDAKYNSFTIKLIEY